MESESLAISLISHFSLNVLCSSMLGGQDFLFFSGQTFLVIINVIITNVILCVGFCLPWVKS